MNISSELLGKLPLFSGLTTKELEVLRENLVLREFHHGDALFSEGDPARSCFVLIQGTVGVYIQNKNGENDHIAQLEQGAMVGHLALIDNKRRSATCRSLSNPTRLVELTRDDFDRLFWAQNSFAYKILDNLTLDLVQRLRSTNDRLVNANREQATGRPTADGVRSAAEALLGDSSIDEELDPDKVEVCIPTLDQRMRDRSDK
jgi:CRP-like cAMP-binding protein